MDNKEFKTMLQLRTLTLSRKVMKVVDKFPNKRSAWVIADQLFRSVTSIGANITEAQAASSKKDFINFLNYALKSGNEAKYWLTLAKELDSELVSELDEYLKETDELVRIIGSSITTLKNKK